MVGACFFTLSFSVKEDWIMSSPFAYVYWVSLILHFSVSLAGYATNMIVCAAKISSRSVIFSIFYHAHVLEGSFS